MDDWNEFSISSPALAEIGEGLLFQFGVGLAFLATIRKDGSPRLHPVCPVLSNQHLYVLIIPDSPKRWDLRRDGRYALQSFPQARPDSDEFYLSGKARLIEDLETFETVINDARHHASRDEILFELFVDRAMHTRWEGFGTPDLRPVHTSWSRGD
jgi:hypothetical protein